MEIDKVAYIRTESGKILSTKSKGKTKFYIPGGKREVGESDEETLIREVLEELNISIIPKTIKYIGTFKAQADGYRNGIIVKMTCYSAAYEGIMIKKNEIDEIRWLNYKDIDLVSEVDKQIFQFLKKEGSLS
jgi:8-oxo-dGTP diphosphatase